VNAEPKFVVDANLIVKRFVDEDYSAQARRFFLANRQILAPQFLLIEAGNVFLKKVRRQEMTQEAAMIALEAIPLYVQLLNTDAVVSTAWPMALRHDRSFYDAVYVALALEENCRLITADLRLVNAVRSRLGETVVWLGDMPDSVV